MRCNYNDKRNLYSWYVIKEVCLLCVFIAIAEDILTDIVDTIQCYNNIKNTFLTYFILNTIYSRGLNVGLSFDSKSF